MTSVGTTGPFLRSDRLLDPKDFRRVLRQGRRRAHQDLVVVTTPSSKNQLNTDTSDRELPDGKSPIQSRLGLTASRKVGNAVVRNRFKRRTREWFRARRSDFEESVDLVVIARRSGARLSYAELDLRLSLLLGLPRPTTVAPGER